MLCPGRGGGRRYSARAAAAGRQGYSGAAISITLGALPVVDDVSAYIARAEGIFRRYGLNVKIDPVLTSVLAIPMMKKGQIDILGGGNYVSFIEASAKEPGPPAVPDPGGGGDLLAGLVRHPDAAVLWYPDARAA